MCVVVHSSVVSNSLLPHRLQHSGLHGPHHLLELALTHVHWVRDAIQLSHPLSSPSYPAFNLFQHQGFFQWVQLAKLLELHSASVSVPMVNMQDWFPSGLTGWISLQSKGLSRVFSSTTIQEHLFFCAYPSLWFNSHIHMWLLEKQ